MVTGQWWGIGTMWPCQEDWGDTTEHRSRSWHQHNNIGITLTRTWVPAWRPVWHHYKTQLYNTILQLGSALVTSTFKIWYYVGCILVHFLGWICRWQQWPVVVRSLNTSFKHGSGRHAGTATRNIQDYSLQASSRSRGCWQMILASTDEMVSILTGAFRWHNDTCNKLTIDYGRVIRECGRWFQFYYSVHKSKNKQIFPKSLY